MNTILWTQNESPEVPDTIIVDGKICEDNLEAQQAFNLLNELNQKLSLSPKDREKLYAQRRNEDFSHQANYKISKLGVYLQGCFLNVDNVGRKLPYMFYDRKAGSIAEATKTLMLLAERFDRKCNYEELTILEEVSLGRVKKKDFIFCSQYL